MAGTDSLAAQAVSTASGDKVFLQVSATDVNRLIFPEDVAKAIVSQEKGVSAQINGRDVFVKFTRPRPGNTDAYFIGASGEVYGLVLVPREMAAETAVIKPHGFDRLKTARLETSGPYEATLKRLIRAAYGEAAPEGYTEVRIGREVAPRYQELRQTHLRTFRGELYEVKEYLVRNVSGQPLTLAEDVFIEDEQTLAVALEEMELKPQAETRLFVVSETGGNDR